MTQAEMARKIFAAALDAVEPFRALLPHLEMVAQLYRQERLKRLVVAGFGKAALPMALASEAVLDCAITAGMVIVPHGATRSPAPRRIAVASAGHPDPDLQGVAASRGIVELARRADADTLLLLLASGGGSALFTAPAPGITLEEKLATSRLLMLAGADIVQLNTVRKHLSAVKGGRLAALAHPARIVTLAISDVPGDRPDVIASGPAYPDPTSFHDALSVLHDFGIAARVPWSVRHLLQRGAEGALPETPKPGDPLFEQASTVIAARNRDALDAAARAAKGLGLQVRVRDELVCGEARRAGALLAGEALRARAQLAEGEALCLISGGETTVAVQGGGKGGRNQEMAVAFALAIGAIPGITFLAAGTDGVDGPTDAAGGIVDAETIPRARAAGCDIEAGVADNDTYGILEQSGALLKSGPTGTNVMDLQIILIAARSLPGQSI